MIQNKQFTAELARKTALDKINSSVDSVLKIIKKAAEKGDFSVTVDADTFNERTKKFLTSQPFNYKIGGVVSNGHDSKIKNPGKKVFVIEW